MARRSTQSDGDWAEAPYRLGHQVLLLLRWRACSLRRAELCQTRHRQAFFAPEDALQALVSAAKAKDRTALAKIFGSDYDKLLSGDARGGR